MCLAAAAGLQAQTPSGATINSVPYTETFDTYGTHSYGGGYPYPTYWTKLASDTTSNFPFISPSRTHSGVGALYFSSGYQGYVYAIMPMISSTLNMDDLRLTFWAEPSSVGHRVIVGLMSDTASIASFTALDTIEPSSGSVFEYFRVNLTNHSTAGRYVAFKVACNPTTGYGNLMFIDDVVLENIPDCDMPASLTAAAAGNATSALLTWDNATSSDNAWQLYYKTATDSIYDSIVISTNPYTLTGLQASTTYNIHLRTVCSTSLSPATADVTYTTPCETVSLPYSQNFENLAANDDIPSCMSIVGTSSKFNTYTATTTHRRHPHGGNGFASFKYGCNNHLFLPAVELTAGTQYMFSFYYATDGESGWQKLEAKLFGSASAADSIMMIGNGVYNATDTAYTLYNGFFTPATDGTYYIGIYCKANSSPWYLCIDDISLTEMASSDTVPPAFVDVTDSSTGVTAVRLHAIYTPGANVTVTAHGFAYKTGDTTAYTFVDASSWSDSTMQADLTGLVSNGTTYEYKAYIAYSSDAEPDTVFSATNTFQTGCAAVTTFPYDEGFDGTGIPECYTQEQVSGNASWTVSSSYASQYASSCFLYLSAIGTGHTTRLVTPELDMRALTLPVLSFSYISTNATGSVDSLYVLYRHSDSAAWSVLARLGEATTWSASRCVLPRPGNKCQIAFEGHLRHANGIGLDSIRVYDNMSAVIYDTTLAAICPGSSYDFRGTALTQDGIYFDTIGADTIHMLVLSHNPDNMQMDGNIVADMTGLLTGTNTYEIVNSANGTVGSTGEYYKNYVSNGLVFAGITMYGGMMPIGWGPSNLTSTTDAYSGYIVSASHGGKDGAGDTYLTGYYSDYGATPPHCTVAKQDMTDFQPVEVWVNNSLSAYNYMSGSWPTGSNHWEKLNIVGYDSNNDSVASASIFLGMGDSVLSQWTAVDLSAFPSVSMVRFYLSSDDLMYGYLNVPSYFCIDNFTIAGTGAIIDTAVICEGDSYTFGSNNLAAAGIYYDTVANQYGCDSLAILNLTVKPISTATTEDHFCDGTTYVFGGTTITEGGVYTDTLTNVQGCDSIVTLTLAMYPASAYSFTDTLLNGSYSYEGNTYTEAGTYTIELTNQYGCDSIVTLTLVEAATSGIAAPGSAMLRLYPNPSHDIVYVEMAVGDAPCSIAIYDLHGRCMMLVSADGSTPACIDISALPRGAYMVKVSDSLDKRVARLIVE